MYTVRAHEHVSAHPTLSWAKGMFQTCLNGLKGEGVTDVKLLRGDTTYFYATYKDGDIEVFTRDGTSVFKGKSGDPGVSTVMQTLEVDDEIDVLCDCYHELEVTSGTVGR
eukprot:m.226744 g.226744  ORF g.226744 m.226744 type:complete len:110 (+) comp25935_c1_seq6:6671-7000(+)